MVSKGKKNIANWKGGFAERLNTAVGNRGAVIVSTMKSQMNRKRADYIYSADYVRYSSLELVAQEINKNSVAGSVAELGVFRGDFAARINEAFPKKKLYLFDTFEGFSDEDVKIETKNKFTKKMDDFSNTNVDLVLSKMKHRQKCVIKKGYFPETAKGLDEKFAFVSIDADLYKPIYDGLKYFYPRLVKGGYIFIHDYNNDNYAGAKAAVKQYCSEKKIALFPLSDAGGSAVIMK